MKIIETRTYNARREQNAGFINVPVPVMSGYCWTSKSLKVTFYPSGNCQKVTFGIIMSILLSVRQSVRPSARPHGSTLLPLDEFS